jgi:predicted peptidase
MLPIRMNPTFLLIILSLLSTGCLHTRHKTEQQIITKKIDVQLDSIKLFDKSRNRLIPVALYYPKTKKQSPKQKIVIFSHGYGANVGGDYLIYSYLTENLAANGYFVASIQHELPTDDFIPTTGNLQIVRRPFWERGADNIQYVIQELKKSHPGLDFKSITLIGHSNGGDMTALFPQKYPNVVAKIVTMDNRRMALPRADNLEVYSLRSSDFPADEGVLPSSDEQLKYKMKIIMLPNTKHGEMDNDANPEQRKEINNYIMSFLKN